MRFDLLGGEHAGDRGQQAVAVEQLEIPRQLLDTVDLAAALDLHRHRATLLVAGQDVHRADRGHVLPAHQGVAVAEQLDMFGQQFLQVRFDAVLHQAGVDAEFVAGVVLDRLQGDAQLLACLVLHHPHRMRAVLGLGLDEPARRAHPVQWLVGAVVGVHADRAVSLDEQQPARGGQMGSQPADVVDGALGYHEAHRTSLGCPGPDKLG